MNRLVLMPRPYGRSHQLVKSCQRYNALDAINCQKRAFGCSTNFGDDRPGSSTALGNSRSFLSSSRSFQSDSKPFHSGSRSFQNNSKPFHSSSRSFQSDSKPFHSGSRSFQRDSKPFQYGLRSFHSDSGSRTPVESTAKESSVPPKEFSEIPGMKSWPVLGSLVQLMTRKDFDTKRYHIMWKNMIEEYGPIIKVSLPGMPPFVCSTNPDDLETIYKSTANDPRREAFEALKNIRQKHPDNYFNKKGGLLPENGDEWWRLRSRVQGPLLKPKNVAAYLPKVDKATRAYMARIDLLQEKTGQVPDDFLEDLYKWALECVGVVALNQELGCLDPDLKADSVPMQLLHHIDNMFVALNETELGIPIWKLYKTKAYVGLETAHNSFLQIADKALQDAAKGLEEAKAAGDPNRTLTVMEMFLNTEGLSKSDVATMILDMIFAGVDTTSHTLAFALFALSTNPAAQTKLQQEVDAVLGSDEDLQADHINQMVYLQNVVKETLRLYPLTVGNVRVLTEDIVMSGYKVPAGCAGVGFNWLICRDEKNFARPNEFLPERWARDRPHGRIHPYASLPFSTGTRMCIGKRIAEQEIYTFLIRTMQKYSVTFESTREMEVMTQLVLKPAIPLRFKFHLRKQ